MPVILIRLAVIAIFTVISGLGIYHAFQKFNTTNGQPYDEFTADEELLYEFQGNHHESDSDNEDIAENEETVANYRENLTEESLRNRYSESTKIADIELQSMYNNSENDSEIEDDAKFSDKSLDSEYSFINEDS